MSASPYQVSSRCLILAALWLVASLSDADVVEESGAPLPHQAVSELAEASLSERPAMGDYLLLPRVGDYARSALHIDPVEAAVARGEWSTPEAGDTVVAADGSQVVWCGEHDPDGPDPATLVGGYAYATMKSKAKRTMLMSAPGAAAVCLNGEWIAGDPYAVGWFRPPVTLRTGENSVLVHLARPDARVEFMPPPEPLQLLSEQATVPDLIAGDTQSHHASIVLVHTGAEAIVGHEVVAIGPDGEEAVSPLPRVSSESVTRVTFRLPVFPDADPGESLNVVLSLRSSERAEEEIPAGEPLAETVLTLQVKDPESAHVRTHRSHVDGSAQPYAVSPPAPGPDADGAPGVLVVLHDAGEDFRGLLERFEPVPSLWVIAPHGRGAYGFDWEDWSAEDAWEALTDLLDREEIDPRRISITGRGMGGHGALVLATRRPSGFASVHAVDAWNSLYVERDTTALDEVLSRQSRHDDPLTMLANLGGARVDLRCAQGDAQGRLFRRRLGAFHTDFMYSEVKEIDWNAIAREAAAAPTVPRDPDRVQFVTPSVGLTNTVGWATLLEQERPGALSYVTLERDRESRTFSGSTTNAQRLELALDGFPSDENLTARIDGRVVRLRWPRRSNSVTLVKADGQWRRARGASPRNRNPSRPGGLKSVFTNQPHLVYGTRGDDGERKWAEAKARFDAQLFLYRGGGHLEVTPDTEFDPFGDPDRNVVLYGNFETNRACVPLFPRGPVVIASDQIEVGPRPEQGDDLGLLLVRPRRGGADTSTALIGGTGEVGMRMTTRLRYFWSGVAYPDLLMIGPRATDPSPGEKPVDDVRAAGYFGADWGVESGDFVWRDLAL